MVSVYPITPGAEDRESALAINADVSVYTIGFTLLTVDAPPSPEPYANPHPHPSPNPTLNPHPRPHPNPSPNPPPPPSSSPQVYAYLVAISPKDMLASRYGLMFFGLVSSGTLKLTLTLTLT